jgi:ribosomal protein S18 acetylase RimI-like enzyme
MTTGLHLTIRPFLDADEADVIELWNTCGLTRPWNDPRRDIARKLAMQREWFFVGLVGDALVASAMAGYDGHRGSLYYLAVAPTMRRRGFATALIRHVETALMEAGCPKLNLLVRSGNEDVIAFYRQIGYSIDETIQLGRRLIPDLPG